MRVQPSRSVATFASPGAGRIVAATQAERGGRASESEQNMVKGTDSAEPRFAPGPVIGGSDIARVAEVPHPGENVRRHPRLLSIGPALRATMAMTGVVGPAPQEAAGVEAAGGSVGRSSRA